MIGLDFPLGPSITPTAAQLDITASKLSLSSDSRPIIAFAPTANFPDKQWHNENYLSLAKALTAEGAAYAGARVAIFGAPGEEAQAAPVVEGCLKIKSLTSWAKPPRQKPQRFYQKPSCL